MLNTFNIPDNHCPTVVQLPLPRLGDTIDPKLFSLQLAPVSHSLEKSPAKCLKKSYAGFLKNQKNTRHLHQTLSLFLTCKLGTKQNSSLT